MLRLLRYFRFSNLVNFETKNQIVSHNLNQLTLKQLSLNVKQRLLNKYKDEKFWLQVENQLLQRIEITNNPQKIRSYANLVYNLAKSQHFTTNFETKFSLLLPFASHQSFTMIVNSISRMGTFSSQFSYIVKKFYEMRKKQFNIREKVTINYALVRNNVEFDMSILNQIQSMNIKQITTTMRMLDMEGIINQQILKHFCHHICLRKKQINVMDLSYCVQVLFKHQYFPQNIQSTVLYGYKMLKRNIDEHSFQHIWKYFPQMVNQNKLNIVFVQMVILTMKIIYKKGAFTKQMVTNINKDIRRIQNLQIRLRCQLK